LCRRRALNLPEEVPLLPASEDDDMAAKLAFYAHDTGGAGASTQQVRVLGALDRIMVLAGSLFGVCNVLLGCGHPVWRGQDDLQPTCLYWTSTHQRL
jgi:hypothetical protein